MSTVHHSKALRILASLASISTYYVCWRKVRRNEARIEHLERRAVTQRLEDVIRGAQ